MSLKRYMNWHIEKILINFWKNEKIWKIISYSMAERFGGEQIENL